MLNINVLLVYLVKKSRIDELKRLHSKTYQNYWRQTFDRHMFLLNGHKVQNHWFHMILYVCVADVGGFVQDPDPELLVRWYQAGALQPFFRGHSAKTTKRREPWLFGEEVTSEIRSAVQDRYRLLPYWYTLFHPAHTSALPPIRYCIFICNTALFKMTHITCWYRRIDFHFITSEMWAGS